MFETNKINAPEKFAKNMRLLYLMISLVIDFKFIFLTTNDYLMTTNRLKSIFNPIIKRFIVLTPKFVQILCIASGQEKRDG